MQVVALPIPVESLSTVVAQSRCKEQSSVSVQIYVTLRTDDILSYLQPRNGDCSPPHAMLFEIASVCR